MAADWHFDGERIVDIFPECLKKWAFRQIPQKDIHTLVCGSACVAGVIHHGSRHVPVPVDNQTRWFPDSRPQFF
jgi:hypothetical protein